MGQYLYDKEWITKFQELFRLWKHYLAKSDHIYLKEMLRGDLITVLTLLKRGRGEMVLISQWPASSCKEMEWSCIRVKFRLEAGSSHRGGGHQNRLPKEEVMARSLPELTETSGQPFVTQIIVRDQNSVILMGNLQLKIFYDRLWLLWQTFTFSFFFI